MTKESKRPLSVYESAHQSVELSSYLKEVNLWHGYIKYLGLPQLNDHKDTPIQNLFVLPHLSDSWISADRDVNTWPQRRSVLDVLSDQNFLVILGEPGGGKSTLVNWLTWRLAGGRYPKELGALVPFPMVLRDLELSAIKSWDDLLNAFIDHPMSKALKESKGLVNSLLLNGDVIVLIDGIDEVSDLSVRQRLKDAVGEGRLKYPKIKWMLTSRIVGYEELPFEDETKRIASLKVNSVESSSVSEIVTSKSNGTSSVFYVCPFDNGQIKEFCSNWYALRERSKAEAQAKAGDLVAALQEDRSTLRLARTPNLLTMMALLHRVKARLPHGRTLLYEDISHAYLHTIDDYRKLLVGENYPLQYKKRWLAKVAWELQCKRAEDFEGVKNILASREDLLRWFSEAMVESGISEPEKSARNFLDYIAKRSGLLIPRSENMFAFLHLSFQEYFSSIYILDQFESEIFGSPGKVRSADLGRWVTEPVWVEVIVFLFELGSLKASHWSNWLLERAFGKNFSKFNKYKSEEKNFTLFEVLFKILSNPHSGLTPASRVAGLDPLIDSYCKSSPYLDREWVGVLAREYSTFYSEEKVKDLFWRKLSDSKPNWFEMKDGDLEYLKKLPPLDGVKTLYSQKDVAEDQLIDIFPNIMQLYIIGDQGIQNVAALNRWENIVGLGSIKASLLVLLDSRIKNALLNLIVRCDLKDKKSEIFLPSLSDLGIQGEIKDFNFIVSESVRNLRITGASIFSFDGLERMSQVTEIRMVSVIFKGVTDSDIPPNIRKVVGDYNLISDFSNKNWTVRYLNRGLASAVRKRRKNKS